MTATAESDDGPDAVATDQLRAQIQRRLHADAIEHQSGAASTGDLEDTLGSFRGVAIVDDVVGTGRSGLLQLRVIDVGGDDAHWSEHAQELDGHLPEAADADDDDGAVWIELR